MSTRRRGWPVAGALMLALLVAGCGSSGSKSRSTAAPAGTVKASTSPGAKPASSAKPAAGTSSTQGTPAGTQATPSSTRTAASPPQKHSSQDDIELSSPVVREGGRLPARYTCDGADVSPPLRWSSIPAGTAELALFVFEFEGEAPGGGSLLDWAVAGLSPTLRGLAAGALPAGAIVGRNSRGQSRYSICPPPGGIHHYGVVLLALPRPVAAAPGFDADALDRQATSIAESEGLFGFSYERG